jgi:hypothetical protein
MLEVIKVTNGYIVRNSCEHNTYGRIEDCSVFNSWEDCSAFLVTKLAESNNVRR